MFAAELKKQYDQMQELCKASKSQLERGITHSQHQSHDMPHITCPPLNTVTQELAQHRDSGDSHKQHQRLARKPFSVRLDQFIMKTCTKAGLQL